MKPWQKLIYNKYFIDEFYDAVIRRPLDILSLVFYKFIDIQIIDGIVNGVRVLSQASTTSYYLTGLANQWNTQTIIYSKADTQSISVGLVNAVVGDYLIIDSFSIKEITESDTVNFNKCLNSG